MTSRNTSCGSTASGSRSPAISHLPSRSPVAVMTIPGCARSRARKFSHSRPVVPALVGPYPRHAEQREGNGADQHPGEAFRWRSRRLLLELNTVGQRCLDVGEAGAVAVEVLQRFRPLGVNSRQHAAKGFV